MGLSQSTIGIRVYNFLQKVQSHFLFGRSTTPWDPTNPTYYQWLVLEGLPYSIIGVIMFCSMALIIWKNHRRPLKYRTPRHSDNFTTSEKGVPLAFYWVTSGFLILAIVSLALAREEYFAGINILKDRSVRLHQQAQEVEQITTSFNISQISPSLEKALSWMQRVPQYELVLNDAQRGVNGIFGTTMFFSCVFAVIMVILFFTGYRLAAGKLMSTALMVGTLMIPIPWVLASASASTSIFVGDMCPVVEEYIYSKTSVYSISVVKYYLHCEGNNPFANDTHTFEELHWQFQNELNDAIRNNATEKEISLLRGDVKQSTRLVNLMIGLSDCLVSTEAYNAVVQKICVVSLNYLGLVFISFTCFGFIFFFAIWAGMKLRVVIRRIYSNRTALYERITNDELDDQL